MTAEFRRKYIHDILINELDYRVDVSLKCATFSAYGTRKMPGVDPIIINFI
jgi:hypothetical protein